MEAITNYTALSFGAGIQSTALILLLKHEPERLRSVMGDLPNKAYFADTGAEMKPVYEHFAHLQSQNYFTEIPVEVVSNGTLIADGDNNWSNRSFIPYFTRNIDGSVGMLRRKCTSEFKIKPIEQAIRRDIGLHPRQRGRPRSVGLWLGISVDEAVRVRDNRTKLINNLYPLISLGWDRQRCADYCREHLGYVPTKSRCFCCPFISDWSAIRRDLPAEFARAAEFDTSIRFITARDSAKARPTYLHRNCTPLSEAVVNQGDLFSGYFSDDFAEECSGHCGI